LLPLGYGARHSWLHAGRRERWRDDRRAKAIAELASAGVIKPVSERDAAARATRAAEVDGPSMSDADTLAQFWSENLSLNEIGARPVAIRPDGQRACAICGAPAYFGFGVSIREGREGRWACREHRGAVDRMSQAERESQ
jgi:hypothetical protein